MKEVIVIAPNEVGSLAVIAEALGGVGVNIEAISAYAKDNKAIFRLLTNDATTTIKAISRLQNFSAKDDDVLLLKMTNRPGELGKITRKLANNKVNLESLYIVSKSGDSTEVAIKPIKEDFERAKEILKLK